MRRHGGGRGGRIAIGVSACLLGQPVRYDGGHRLSLAVVGLGRRFRLIPVCPEVAAGLGVPRPPMHLVGSRLAARAVGVDDPSLDYTARLIHVARSVQQRHRFSGFIFKARSPSCGLGAPGPGVFARTLRRLAPDMPCIEDEALGRSTARIHFLAQVLAFASRKPREYRRSDGGRR